MANPRKLKRIDPSHAEPDEGNAPRDPVSGLERNVGQRTTGYGGGDVSRNPANQGEGDEVVPMTPGRNSG